MTHTEFHHAAAALVCGLGMAIAQGAGAQSVEQFYQGRTVALIIPTATGGINDLSGRLVARHIGRFIPGEPTILAQNKAAGGGVSLLNDFASSAPRDGPLLAIQGDPQAKFDPQGFTWLGSLSSFADDAYMLVVNATHPARTVDDLKKP